MLKRQTFRIDGDVIHITNVVPGSGVALLVIATVLAILPLVRPYLPNDTYVVFEEGTAGWCLWLFGIFACLSAAFWWSTVVIDRNADEVVIRRRCGLFRSEFRYRLSSFTAVALREDDEGEVSVYVEGRAANTGLEINRNKALVWGRGNEEAQEIARCIAAHLNVELNSYCRTEQLKRFV